jgi:3-dehydroquinate dehydratase-1
MRQQSRIQLNIRGTVIGGVQPCICLPLVAESLEGLFSEVKELLEYRPDILEWRVDGFKGIADTEECLGALKGLRTIIGDVPLIFTCRIEGEGGMQSISQPKRLELICGAIDSGEVDLVDVELDNDDHFLDTIIDRAKTSGVKLIFSHHNFKETPPEKVICEVLERAQARGADIAKIAVMPHCYTDVLTLLSATNASRIGKINIPMITISMGIEGGISRLAGGLFGSDVTFAAGRESSAPGQHAIADLRSAMSLLYSQKD